MKSRAIKRIGICLLVLGVLIFALCQLLNTASSLFPTMIENIILLSGIVFLIIAISFALFIVSVYLFHHLATIFRQPVEKKSKNESIGILKTTDISGSDTVFHTSIPWVLWCEKQMALWWLVGFCVIAAWLIFEGKGVIIAIIWLLSVLCVLWSFWRESPNAKRFLLDSFSVFSRQRFFSIENMKNNPPKLVRGFVLWGHRFELDKIALAKITGVTWNMGQFSRRAGEDVSDWSVILWFQSVSRNKKNYKSCWEITSPCDKASAYLHGHNLINFLWQNGSLRLVQGKNDHSFERIDDAKKGAGE